MLDSVRPSSIVRGHHVSDIFVVMDWGLIKFSIRRLVAEGAYWLASDSLMGIAVLLSSFVMRKSGIKGS